MKKLIFGTNNNGKLAEVSALAEHHNIEVISLDAAGIALDCAEDGTTFEENARQKLTAITDQTRPHTAWVACEDAGLQIDALEGLPGVRTRRWAGYEMGDQELVDYTLEQLQDVPYQDRGAQFRSAVALMHSTNPGAVHVFEGVVEGKILQKADTRQPLNGLPFRQLFFIPEIGRMIGDTEGLLKAGDVSFLTHRQRAFSKAFNYIHDLETIEN